MAMHGKSRARFFRASDFTVTEDEIHRAALFFTAAT
jgi:hypothetical protein